MVMKFKKAVRLSLLLHMSPLLLLMHIPGCGGGGGKGKGGEKKPPTEQGPQQQSNGPGIKEMPKSIDVDTVTEHDINGYKKAMKKKFKPRKCPSKSYGGVGIQYGPEKLIVDFAPSEYPAGKAGVEVGDELTDDAADIEKYRGEVGGEVTINVRKPDGSLKNYTMLREKICLKDEKNEKE
jgi:hypothetical protein